MAPRRLYLRPARAHVISRGTVRHVTTQPATPEGRLLRTAREDAGLTMQQAADAIGISRKQLGEIERGISQGREFHPPDRTLAPLAAKLGVTPEQLTAAGRENAARIVADMQPAVADDDRVMETLIASRPDGEFLWFLWRETGNDMKLLPREHRVRRVLEWVEAHPVNAAGTESETG